ncbi:FAM136A-like protein [Tanacetum coccineum]
MPSSGPRRTLVYIDFTHLEPYQDPQLTFRKQEHLICIEYFNAVLFAIADTERLNRSLMVCQDKYEAARLQKKTSAMQDMESCVNLTIEDNVKSLPHLVAKLKASLAIDPTTE